MADELKGEARVLALADRARACGGIYPSRLYHEAVLAQQRGEIGFGEVSRVYRHAAIHAGLVVPRDRPRFHICPTCSEPLNVDVQD